MADLLVRAARREDLPALLALYEQLDENDPSLRQDEHVEEIWDSVLTRPGLHVLVGGLDGKLASTCTLAVVPNLARGGRPHALVENVVTDARRRKRGFGTRVMKRAIEMAREHDCYEVMLLYGSSRLGIVRTLPRILPFLALLSGASLVVISLLLVGVSASFWITDSWPLLALAARLREFAPYPLTIFDGFFRLLLTHILPVGFVASVVLVG